MLRAVGKSHWMSITKQWLSRMPAPPERGAFYCCLSILSQWWPLHSLPRSRSLYDFTRYFTGFCGIDQTCPSHPSRVHPQAGARGWRESQSCCSEFCRGPSDCRSWADEGRRTRCGEIAVLFDRKNGFFFAYPESNIIICDALSSLLVSKGNLECVALRNNVWHRNTKHC